MSISSQNNYPEAEIVRERVIPKATIKKIVEKTIELFSSDPTNFLMIMFVLIAGIGELFGREFSWKWYIFFGVITIIFALDKFQIFNKGYKEQVIVRSEKPKSFNAE